MKEAYNIRQIGGFTSNPRIAQGKIDLYAKTTRFCWYRPDGDGYEQMFEETTTQELMQQRMRLRGARKQRAAKLVRPIEIVKVLPSATPVGFKQAMRILNRPDMVCENDTMVKQLSRVSLSAPSIKSERDLKIERLEAEMRRLVRILEGTGSIPK